MVLRIGGNLDMKVIAGFVANELDQFVRVLEIICTRSFFRNIAAQGNQAGHAPADIALQQLTDLLAARAYAGYMGGY